MSKSIEIPNVRPPKLADEWVNASSASGSNADQPSTEAPLAAPEELPGSEATAQANAAVPEPSTAEASTSPTHQAPELANTTATPAHPTGIAATLGEPTIPTKRLTVDIPSDLHRRFKANCSIEERHISDVVRELVDGYLAKKQSQELQKA